MLSVLAMKLSIVGLVFIFSSKCSVCASMTFGEDKLNSLKKTGHTTGGLPNKFGLGTDLSSDVIAPAAWYQSGLRSSDRKVANESIFRAFWNAPKDCGLNFSIDLPLADYGIEFNSNHEATHGNVVNLLGKWLGFYPRWKSGHPVNGGLPQLANITAHLEKATADILATIPDPDFEGIGVINFEEWRPQWEQNFDTLAIYRKQSVIHVRTMHPEWDDDTVELVAKLEWEQGAKVFMESTLKLAKQLRPKAMWGYYHYPFCFNNKETVNMSCGGSTAETNNNIMWLFNASSALFPSIYLISAHKYERAFVRSRLLETFRVVDESSDPKIPVFSYVRFNYTHTNLFYSLEDLNNTILQSAELATNGIVFWGSEYDTLSAQNCNELRDYINTAIGPTVLKARHGAMSCSERVCSGHGRCVGNIFTCDREGGRNERVNGKYTVKSPENDICTCRCFKGWEGGDCSVQSTH